MVGELVGALAVGERVMGERMVTVSGSQAVGQPGGTYRGFPMRHLTKEGPHAAIKPLTSPIIIFSRRTNQTQEAQ
eukprot:5926428-Pyramimonas_sp.AAC.1